jgi:hypothetical protein
VILNRKSASLIGKATVPVIEFLEARQLLSGTLSISSLVNNTMVFNAVEGTTTPAETLTLTDTGTTALTLGPGSATVGSSYFSVTDESSIPASLAPGASFGLTLTYSATAVTTNNDTLTITSGSSTNPTLTVALSGIGTVGLGGSNQPSLATIVGQGPNDADAAADSNWPTSAHPQDPSSQEVDLQRLTKAGAGPVTIDVLASFTASGTHPYTLGTYTPGDPNTASLNQLFTTPSSEDQSTYVQPVGATSFDPGTASFGFYTVSNAQVAGRVIYTEDALNTFDTNTGRHFKFFPMEQPNGTIIANEYIMTSTEWNAPVGYDFTNIVAIVSNVRASSDAPLGPTLGLQNLDAVPGSDTMVFNRIQSPNTVYPNTVHNQNVLQINNTGNASGGALIINSYTLSTGYSLVNPPTFPVDIQPGASLDLTIQFNVSSEPSVPYNETNSGMYASGGGVVDGTLTLDSNDVSKPTASVALAGWYQFHSENSNEPSLQSIVNLLFGYSTDINPTPTPTLTESASVPSSPTYYGQEVVSNFWEQADTGTDLTVGVEQIAGYHTEGNIATTYWYPQGTSTYNKLFVTAPDSGQTLFPLQNGSSTALAAATFSSTGTFGFRVDNEWSNDAQNTNYASGGGHHYRFYPLINSAGQVIPNDYIMTMDYSNDPQNFDFQDNVWIVTNIKPATVASGITSPQTTGGGPATPLDFYATNTTGGNLLQWGEATSSGVGGFNISSSTSSAGPYTQLNSSLITSLSYVDSTAATSGTTYYEVTAIGASTGDPSLAATASVANANSSGGGGTTPTGSPMTMPVSANTSAGVAVTVDELATASDASGTIVPASVIVTTQPADGTTSVNASNGAITYTPDPGFTGTDTFQYTVTDTTGATSAPETITIHVMAVPVGDPMAADYSVQTAYETAISINVVANASEGTAGVTLSPSTVTITSPATHGTTMVDPATGSILYTPVAGYSGSDTFMYSIGDSLGATSPAATVTITVEPAGVTPTNPIIPIDPGAPNPMAANITAAPIDTTGSATVNVISSASDSNGALNQSSTAITVGPSHGTAAVNTAAGTITYIPNAGFIGLDTVEYTVSDINGSVSAPGTLTISVGVTINDTTAKSLTFTDANGSKVRVVLSGVGSGIVSFNGSGTYTTVPGPHGTGTITASGTGLSINSIQITGTTITSALTVTRTGSAMVSLGNISVTGELSRLLATTSNLNGNLSVSGALTLAEVGSITSSTITIGATDATRSGLTLIAGNVTNTSLTSAIPIRTLRVTNWFENGTTDAITAPSITSLAVTGNFEAGLTATGASPYALQAVSIRGQISADPWDITGNTASVVVGSVAPGWTGNFTGITRALTIRTGGFAGTLTAGTLDVLSITGNDTGGVNAASIGTMRVNGQLDGGYVITTNGVIPRAYSLAHLVVTGQTTNSSITAAGNIASISTGSISGSSIDAGINNGTTLPTTAADFASNASITSIAVTGRGATFSDSDIAAATLGSLSLGEIITASSETRFGIAADTIRAIALTLDSGGGPLHLNATELLSPDSIATVVATKMLALNAFEIVTGL